MDVNVAKVTNLPIAMQASIGQAASQANRAGNFSEFAAVLAGADVGLALFDSDLRLLACNDLYRGLCGYSADVARPGVSLVDLIRISLSGEAVLDEQGQVRLLESVTLSAARQALAIILAEMPLTSTHELALLSERALAEDWNRPEEDTAWSHLQPGQSS